jgi:hypothetical protein
VKKLFKVLLGTSLFLLEQSDDAKTVRARAARKTDDLRDVVQQKYEDAAERVARASRAIRGQDNQALGNALRLAAGVGVGVGLGLLFAPASGEATRRAIGGGAVEFRNKVRKRVLSERARATATAG